MGWAVGTAISAIGGVSYGLRADGPGPAFGGGALVGGVSIAIGCLLAYAMGGMPIQGVIAATLVGVVSGAVAGLMTRLFAKSPAPASQPANAEQGRG